MNEWQERVQAEKFALCEKIDALRRWLVNPPVTAEATDISLLQIQLSSMQTYAQILSMRISRFK